MSITQQLRSLSRVAAVSALALIAAGAQAATLDLAGSNGTGYLAFSNVKNTTSASIAEGWNYPYYLGTDNIYHSIATSPLSSSSTYSEEANFTVLGKDITQTDFATFSAGTIGYDETTLTGVGTEVISVAGLTLTINSAGFSPYLSAYNTGSGLGDFAFNYTITPSNLTGGGLTFTNGVLTSVDLDASIAVKVGLGTNPAFALGSLYNGTLSIDGASYAFNLDETKNNTSPLGALTNTHMVFNRAGSIAAVTAVPEPSTVAMMAAGLALVGLVGRRRLRG